MLLLFFIIALTLKQIKLIADALGFLAFEEGQSRFDGNQGIKDQQLALKWIHDNIRNFGGDKNKVNY